MDENRPSSEQECSKPNEEFPLPVITNVFSLAVNPTSPNGIPETTADSARLVEEKTNSNPGVLPDGVCAPRVRKKTLPDYDRVPRVRKKRSDRKYERRPRVNSQVSPAVAEIQILLPITIHPASLNLMPAGFDQPQTSTDMLSQEPRTLDAAQPTGYQSSFGVIHSPLTQSALLYVQQPGEQPSSVPPVPVIETACSSQVPSATISRPPQHSQYSTEVIEEAMALTSGYSDVFMDHPSLTESATALQSNTSSQQQNMYSPSPQLNSAFIHPWPSSSPAANQLLEDATPPSGISYVPSLPSKSIPQGKQLSQTNQQPVSVLQEHVSNLPGSNSSEANMIQGIDVCKVRAVEADMLMQSSVIQPSVHSAMADQTTKQGSTILQVNGLPQAHEVNSQESEKKSHLLTAAQKAETSAGQTAKRFKNYHTQVWMRNQFGTPSSQAKQHGTSQQTQPQKASCSDKAMYNEKQSPTCTHLRNALNSSWDRIVVSSDVASKLSLQEVRRGIETFLASRVNQRMVFKDRIIRLHWDGKDLGTFRYKDAVTSAPTITIEDAIIISSSDDEVTKVDTASSVTPPTVGTSGGVTRDPHVTADGSKESVMKDIETPTEPRVILAVCSTSDSEDCSDMDDVTDGRKAPKSSDEDPTYSPDEEEISSEDKTSSDNSDFEVCSEPSSGSFVNPSANNGFDASSTQDSLLGPPTENQYSIKPLGKGHKKKHIGSCRNLSPKKRQLRHHYLRPNARKRKYSDDSFDSSQSDIDISSDKSSSPIQRRNAKKSRARRPQDCTAIIPKTLSRQTAKVIPDIVVPADIICQPCSVQLLRLKDNLLHNGRVNLSVIKVEELFVTDNNVTASDDTWACIANTLSLAHELDIGSPW